MDRAGHEGFARAFYAAFPDLHHEVEHVVAEQSHVVVRCVLHGTQTGAFFGIPATKRKISVPAHLLLRLEGGKVAALLGVFDEAGMMRQLGVMPS
jgi:predicted ester cyclase